MSGSANNSGYGAASPYNSPWGPGSGWGGGWDYWRCWHTAKPLWIAAMILGFIFWWPIGLILLFTGMWSKRMGTWACGPGWSGPQQGPWSGGSPPWAGWKSFVCGERRERPAPQAASSGNHAFDEYRAETLRRLEDEQKEFATFLERLRFAKDQAEFDQFMAERRGRPPAPTEGEQPQG